MAEILLSLTIIGVVAAITLPSLTGNINERTWNTQRKALYARMSQAIALMPSLNGYGKLTEETEDQSAIDTVAETFITEGLAKVLKINNICDNEHLTDCGLPNKIIPFDLGTSNQGNISLGDIKTLLAYNPNLDTKWFYHMQDTKAAAFETANGESILVYYNPKCTSAVQKQHKQSVQPFICANFIYDLNGSKGPNTGGKDIGFITALYATDSTVVTAIPDATANPPSGGQDIVTKLCKNINPDLRVPNIEELAAMYYNKTLIGMPRKTAGYYWSSSPSQNEDPQSKWLIQFDDGYLYQSLKDITWEPVRCIKR